MLKIQRSSGDRVVVFSLTGRIRLEHVHELQRLLDVEKVDHQEGNDRIALNLEEVTLIDRDVVNFLARCEINSVGISNCPAYIREWIDREKKRGIDS
jgi:ABC-type enterochelin transport system substrate-binding protein